MKIHPYLTFDGRCADAFRFYQSVLGGELFSQTFGESPMADQCPPGSRDHIMHACLTVGEVLLMGSDAPPQWREEPQGFSVSLHTDTVAEAERVFAALSEGGEVRMPLGETFWAQRFGMFVDRFGIPWMVNCSKPA